MGDNLQRRRSVRKHGHPKVDKPPAPVDILFSVALEEEDGKVRNLNISLHSHCLLCLRRIVPHREGDPGGKRSRGEKNEEAPALEFLRMISDLSSFLRTLEWMWWSLARDVKDVRDVVGKGLERGRVVRFGSMPKLCESCGESLCKLDTLLNSVREQLGKVKVLTAEAKRRSADLEVSSKLPESTMEFMEEIWNTRDSPEVKEEPSFLNPQSDEDNYSTSDPLTFHDNEQDFKSEADEETSQMEGDEDKDGDYIKSEGDEDSGTDHEESVDLDLNESAKPREHSGASSTKPATFVIGGQAGTPIILGTNPIPIPTNFVSFVTKPKPPKKSPMVTDNGGAQVVTCPICRAEMSGNNLRAHLKLQHNLVLGAPLQNERPPRQFPPKAVSQSVFGHCDLCMQRMKRSQLYEHLKGHVGEEYVLRCFNPECSFACATYPALGKHYERGKVSFCRDNFRKHAEVFKKKLCQCPECPFVSTTRNRMRVHLTKTHETAKDKKFPCPISGCGAAFTVQESVRFHLTDHQDPSAQELQVCPLCLGSNKLSLKQMEGHLKDKHGAKEVFRCVHCSFVFSSREQLIDHLYVHRHGNKLSCDICGDKAGRFPLHTKLLEHYWREHQIGKEWRCDQCPRVYFKEVILRSHVKLAHSTRKSKVGKKKANWQCVDCGKEFIGEAAVRSHAIREHGAEPFGCKFCSETFISQKAAKEHDNVVHKGVKLPEVVDKFPCPDPNCEMVFKHERTCQRHHKTVHLGEKRKHQCGQCGKGYHSQGQLKLHQDTVHLGIRNRVCEECGESFVTPTVLQKHRLIHTGERPFTCELCGQRFRTKVVLNAHLQGHERKGADFKPNGPMKGIRKRVRAKSKCMPDFKTKE